MAILQQNPKPEKASVSATVTTEPHFESIDCKVQYKDQVIDLLIEREDGGTWKVTGMGSKTR